MEERMKKDRRRRGRQLEKTRSKTDRISSCCITKEGMRMSQSREEKLKMKDAN